MKRAIPAVLVSTLIASSFIQAQEPKGTYDATHRLVIRDDRPDDSRGWVIVAKSTYWPLCYESLDRLEESRSLIGGSDQEALADSIDKSAAWLSLAASAAMTNGEAGITDASDLMQVAADAIRDGKSKLTDSQLNDLVTLGEVCMAKSHILRSGDADANYRDSRGSVNKTAKPSAVVKEAELEIRQATTEQLLDQYRYDTQQAVRHLKVAKTYLAAAQEAGGLKLDETITADLPTFTGNEKAWELTQKYDEGIRRRSQAMLQLVEQQRKALVAKLPTESEI